jgi:hypothetical protein
VANKSQFNGELIHFGAVRFRVTGSGDLLLFMHSLDDINVVQLPSLTMISATNKEPVALANYIEQQGFLEFRISGFGNTFTISKLTLFIRPVATGRPQ